MPVIASTHTVVKATRPRRPFGLGINHLADCVCNSCLDESAARRKAKPLRLSDAEQEVLDEIRGDWPPAEALDDEDTDPSEWGDWSDEFVFEPDEADRRWAAEVFNDVIAPELAAALASGALTCA